MLGAGSALVRPRFREAESHLSPSLPTRFSSARPKKLVLGLNLHQKILYPFFHHDVSSGISPIIDRAQVS